MKRYIIVGSTNKLIINIILIIMRIIILGDYLAFNNSYCNISIGETYAGILKDKLEKSQNNEVFLIGSSFNNSMIQSQSIRKVFDIKQFNPDTVIINLGCIDLGLRKVSNAEVKLFASYPNIKDNKFFMIYKKIRFFLIRIKNIRNKPKIFQSNYQKILDTIDSIGALPIIINIPEFTRNNLFIDKIENSSIRKYNDILHKLSKINNCNLIDLNKNSFRSKTKDGYFLSKFDHIKIAELLKNVITKQTI